MKQLSVVIGISFFALVLGGCGKSEEEKCKEKGSNWYWSASAKKCKETTTVSEKKIQKVPQLMPWCYLSGEDALSAGLISLSGGGVHCTDMGTKPACGTVSGSGEPKVYCIDLNDLIVSEASCVSKERELKCLSRQ